jgi:hypothetical protein
LKKKKLKKKSNFEKKRGESCEKMTKCKKKEEKRKRNALWITVVIHSVLCVGEQ